MRQNQALVSASWPCIMNFTCNEQIIATCSMWAKQSSWLAPKTFLQIRQIGLIEIWNSTCYKDWYPDQKDSNSMSTNSKALQGRRAPSTLSSQSWNSQHSPFQALRKAKRNSISKSCAVGKPISRSWTVPYLCLCFLAEYVAKQLLLRAQGLGATQQGATCPPFDLELLKRLRRSESSLPFMDKQSDIPRVGSTNLS